MCVIVWRCVCVAVWLCLGDYMWVCCCLADHNCACEFRVGSASGCAAMCVAACLCSCICVDWPRLCLWGCLGWEEGAMAETVTRAEAAAAAAVIQLHLGFRVWVLFSNSHAIRMQPISLVSLLTA